MPESRQKRGQGSIRTLPSRTGKPRYQVRYTDPNGIRRNASKTFATKALAERELQLIRIAIESGTWSVDNTPEKADLDPRTVTLKELASYWREQRVNAAGQSLSPTTLAEYQRLIEGTLKDFADKPIRAITTQQIERWRAPELRRAPNQTVKAYKHLKTLLTWAHKRRWIATNPCVIERGTSYRSAEPPVPTIDQVRVMLAEAESPFNVILHLAAWGGLRKGEILELRRKDFNRVEVNGATLLEVNIKRSVVWVNALAEVKTPKTAKSVRRVLLPFSTGTSQVVEAYLKTIPLNPDALLFASNRPKNVHWGEFKLKPYWAKVCQVSGFSGRFHSLRAFHLTQLAIQGATAQELMDRAGHSNIETAMRYQRSVGREAQLLERLG